MTIYIKRIKVLSDRKRRTNAPLGLFFGKIKKKGILYMNEATLNSKQLGLLALAVPVEMTGSPIDETDCLEWLGHMEQFAKERFDVNIILRDSFSLPERLPWKHVLRIAVCP